MSDRTKGKSTYMKVGVIVLIVAAGFWFNMRFRQEGQTNVIAITQIVEHPSLDAERHAMTETLEKEGFSITYYNAQGNIATAAQIAQQIVASKPRAVIAISTPSAQTLMTLCQKNNIPFVYSAVTDPSSGKLDGAKGVCDAVPVDSPWIMIRHCQPSIQKVGLIYNAGEANSVHMVQTITGTSSKHGITVEALAVHKIADVSQAIQMLISRGVEAIYIPNDNMAVAAMSNIVAIAHPNGVPVYASDEGSVQSGALAAYSYSRKELGQQAAMMVLYALNQTQAVPPAKTPLSFFVNPNATKLFPKLNFSPLNESPSESKQDPGNGNPHS